MTLTVGESRWSIHALDAALTEAAMRRWGITATVLITGVLVAAPVGVASAGNQQTAGGGHPAPVGMLDCNGFSPIQRPVKTGLPCTEIAANDDEGFLDNGHYVGHDEPDIGFFSTKHHSGNAMTYRMVLPIDPHQQPQPHFKGFTWDFQLSIARWLGMVVCDNESYPEGTKKCTPDSDSNIQVPPRANHAGAAFLELQMYPPGHPPFISSISCDRVHWCAALTIDSLQANFGALHGPGSPPGAIANNNCPEPVNFAWLADNGKPTGPPGPDQATTATFTPNKHTLRMNPGDVIQVTLHDSAAGIFTKISDLTTHRSGFMVGGSASGFRHILWDPKHLTCKGAPYDFHPMYDTAAPPLANGQPTAWTTWAAHTDNIAYDAETGHFEPRDADRNVDDVGCTSGPLIPGCIGSDVDFDGYPYHAVWPNGSGRFPTPNYLTSPRSPAANGTFTVAYPTVRFEVDLPRIEEANQGGGLTCNHHTGAHCTNPPKGAAFYPWYHLLRVPSLVDGAGCAWGISNDMPNQISNFGGEKQAWGPLELTNYGFDKRFHNFARTLANPCP